MKTNRKKWLAAATLGTAFAAVGGAALMERSVAQADAATGFQMVNGASVRISTVDDEAGIRFRAVIGDYNAEENAEYGMMIIRNDWLTEWKITENYVPAVQAKYDELAVNKDEDDTNDVAAPVRQVAPKQIDGKWTVTGSLVGVLKENYDRDFFGIAYKKVGETYTYAEAEANENVRSISSVAVDAMLDDEKAENNTDEAQTCFGKYTESSGAKRVTEMTVDVSSHEGEDFTFLMKATKSNETKTSDVTLAEQTLKLNTESELDGKFTAESELDSDGWYRITVNGDLFTDSSTIGFSSTDSVVVKDQKFVDHTAHTLTVEKSFVQLLTQYKLGSAEEKNEASQYTHTPTVKDNGNAVSAGEYSLALNDDNDWQLSINNTQGTVSAVDADGTGRSTEHSILVKNRYAQTTFTVRVSYPIYTASDLDFLSTVSYYYADNANSSTNTTADQYLNGKYIFMNDIDYSEHTRNYILPIAAMSNESNFITAIDTTNQWGADLESVISVGKRTSAVSYYSVGWKDVLSLEEGEKTVDGETGKYLKNADGTAFAGINSKGKYFGGVMDGNGYAIKNAWLMYDVYMGVPVNNESGGLVAAGGAFIGLNLGTIENLEIDAKTPNNNVEYVNGVYTQKDKDYTNANVFGKMYENISMYCYKIYKQTTTECVKKGAAYLASDNMANASAYTAAVVLFNRGTVKNVYYKADVGGATGGNKSTATGALVHYNAKTIENCVVERHIRRLEDNHHPKYNFTIAVYNAGDNKVKDKDLDTYIAYQAGGSIKGCYSLVSCDPITAWNATDYSHETKLPDAPMEYYNIKYAYFGTESDANVPTHRTAGTVDEISKTVYTTEAGESQTTGQSGQHSKLECNYAGMIEAAQENGNLSEDVWELNATANTVSMKKGIKTIG